jgi:uncharacterized surface protein with fasciclin (FAS1) repeats
MKLLRKVAVAALLLGLGSMMVVGGRDVTPTQASQQGSYMTPVDLFKTPSPAMENPKEAFTTLRKAIAYAGLTSTFPGPGPLTVFAPDDRAFAALPAGELNSLIKDKARLATVLKYHVIVGQAIAAKDLPKAKSLESLEGGMLTFATANAAMGTTVLSGNRGTSAPGGPVITVDDATIIWANIKVGDGIVHAINKVLLPKM